MPDHASQVIVGAGLAGVRAAETLRQQGFAGRVVLIGDEPHRPYERPPLSKGFLQGTQTRDSVFVQDAGWFQEFEIDLRTGVRATAVHTSAHEVELDDGSRLAYGGLLLATGSRPRRLDLPGAGLAGVHHLRTLDDSQALRSRLESAQRLVVIGGGWIGLEVAAAGRAAGVEVTVLEREDLPLQRVLGPEVAGFFAAAHRDHGVDLRGGSVPTRVLGTDGCVSGVELDDGQVVPADLVVVGIGVLPNSELAQGAGLQVADGIVVDAHLRTADPDVYAAGDVANVFHPILGRRVRVEHWANAQNQGPAAARCMLGGESVFADLPFFYTDQYDLGMEYIGDLGPGGYDRVVIRGDLEADRFVAFWISDGRVAAGMHVNEWGAIDQVRELILSGHGADADRLADPDVPIGEA